VDTEFPSTSLDSLYPSLRHAFGVLGDAQYAPVLDPHSARLDHLLPCRTCRDVTDTGATGAVLPISLRGRPSNLLSWEAVGAQKARCVSYRPEVSGLPWISETWMALFAGRYACAPAKRPQIR